MATLAFLINLEQQTGVRQARPVLVWVGALIAVTIIGGIAVLKLREYMRQEDDTSAGHGASMLEQIEAMKKDGRIGDAEYQTLRRQLSEHVKYRMGVSADGMQPTGNRSGRTGFPDAPSAVRAPPGYDLTGEKLPGPPNS